MPEFRRDFLSGDWVIIATGRARRPETFARQDGVEPASAALPARDPSCPFCPGNEAMTPAEVLALGRDPSKAAPDTPGWRVRVVANKYPALEPVAGLEEKIKEEGAGRPVAGDLAGHLADRASGSPGSSAGFAAPPPPASLLESLPGMGRHEVLIESPLHNRQPADFSLEDLALVLEMYHRRCSALAADENWQYIQLFRNRGRAAGASIVHPHSQLIALPFVPDPVRRELERARRYYRATGSCPYCALLARERAAAARIVAENEYFTAFMPYASHFPFEMRLLPRRHQSSFLETSAVERRALAALLGEVLKGLAQALDDPPYNYYLRSAPLRSGPLPAYHWRLELIPRLATPGGFELSTGIYINVTLPEEAARFIREKGGTANHDRSREQSLFYPGLAQSPACGQSR